MQSTGALDKTIPECHLNGQKVTKNQKAKVIKQLCRLEYEEYIKDKLDLLQFLMQQIEWDGIESAPSGLQLCTYMKGPMVANASSVGMPDLTP